VVQNHRQRVGVYVVAAASTGQQESPGVAIQISQVQGNLLHAGVGKLLIRIGDHHSQPRSKMGNGLPHSVERLQADAQHMT